MSERALTGRIGPNAILQMMPVLERVAGPEGALGMVHRAGIAGLPDGTRMIPEGEAARLHQWLRRTMRDQAAQMAAEAGGNTARYIMAHRIPGFAQVVLRRLPAPLAARALAAAITRHAWTFAGSGRFRAVGAWRFEIADNPLVRGEQSTACLCHWNAAVFETLYRALVHPACRCREITCAAQRDEASCRFVIRRD